MSVTLELTEVHRRVLAARGPALLIERPLLADGSISDIPVLTNLFGTIDRVAQGMGVAPEGLRLLGERLAFLKQPTPPRGLRDAFAKLPSCAK